MAGKPPLHHRLSGDDQVFLRHYPSTPHLDHFEKCKTLQPGSTTVARPHQQKQKSTVMLNCGPTTSPISNINLVPPMTSYMPKTTLSTFTARQPANNNSITNGGSRTVSSGRFRDDPNPYKVSDIGEYRIKVHDPFVPKSVLHRSHQLLPYHGESDSYSLSHGQSETDADSLSLNLNAQQQRRILLDKLESASCNGAVGGGGGSGGSNGSTTTTGGRVQRSHTLKSASGESSSQKSSSGCSSNGRSHQTIGGRSSSRVSGSVSISSSGGEVETECEIPIPEPDYENENEGSTTGSSDDLPLPLPDSSCSEEYSSVSASSGSDPGHHYSIAEGIGKMTPSPVNDPHAEHHDRNGADSGLDTPTKISEEERVKIEYALKGRKTTVYVADSLANLYVMRKGGTSSSRSSEISGSGSGATDDWVLKYTGVPVLLLDSGETKSRDKRRIQIVVAELGSGLALWKDVIDNLTSYKVMGSNTFHSFHYSQDHSKIIGLSFDDEESAISFSNRVEKLTSDFANISLSGSKSKGKKGKKDASTSKSTSSKKPAKFVKPKKSEISQPCAFKHVSSLNSNDKGRLSSLQNFILNSATGDGD